ncbi:spermidine synthase [Desulfacinum hydrothermale DSM 13146]|uniref:Polyamine aminopropyltransferase n=1 Tax=Desulfacinum hydrothermale DSM 13146 TaxID=1121390 RepID=A0A1W1XJG4_9BACT|nr:fused MFS/spermidine synthase [Desulfacinum hydrothermale]SMC24123.1 spermidine synthase [Desulfacinum hydrothermale DSM 13146]
MIEEASAHHWFRELCTGGVDLAYLCRSIIFSGRTRFQRVDIVDSPLHGKVLFLDKVLQSAERDEFIYHETLVHPALFSVDRPTSVLIVGGGEGATLREVLRHPSVERVLMVEVDGQLVDIARHFLPEWHQGAFDDPRVELVVGDGRAYLEATNERFHVILLDLSDPVDDSPAVLLYTSEFFQIVRRRLQPGGACAVQAESISPQQCTVHARIYNTLAASFPVARTCPYMLHSFHRPDAHLLGSLDPQWSPEQVARRAEAASLPLRYLSPSMFLGLFILPPYLEQAYGTHQRPLTDTDHQIHIDEIL